MDEEPSLRHRRKVYLATMAVVITTIVIAWFVIRTGPAAIAMTVAVCFVPPFAAIIANRGGPGNRR